MSDRRPTWLIGVPTCLLKDRHFWSKTNMIDRRPTCLIRDRHASSEHEMSKQRPTCLIVFQHAASKTHRRLTCLFGDIHAWLYTNMPGWRLTCLIWEIHIWPQPDLRVQNCFILHQWSIRHVNLLWVSDWPIWSPIRQFVLRWESNNRNICVKTFLFNYFFLNKI